MTTKRAAWFVHEDADALCLQIKLGPDNAVTLTCWKNGDPPDVSLWRSCGSQDLGLALETLKSFVEDIKAASDRN